MELSSLKYCKFGLTILQQKQMQTISLIVLFNISESRLVIIYKLFYYV